MTKDRTINWKILLCCGIFIWFVVNLLQGIFTEIQEDEAYYALYGEHLAWGYFDHPPMVGLMTYLSSLLFSRTLGVRFFTIIASCLSLWVIWRIATFNSKLPTDSKLTTSNASHFSTLNPTLLFFTLAFSIVMFNIYGFVTTPDAGLILFSALFLLVYQCYLAEKSWKNALLMGLTMALMVYSKYHAFLLLGLIVLSNLKLLKDGKFWVACLLALTLLTPHVLWQVNNDFPSFRYHLSGRNEAFKWSYFLEYLPNQLLIFNPFTVGALVYVLIKHRAENAFERGLRFILIGFFFFFWLMAFRGHVEPHWTIVCVIPVVVLVYRKALIDEKLKRYTKFVILPSLVLVLTFRILLLTPLADRFGYHGKEPYYRAIEEMAGDCPMVCRGSFQQPALYHYFTGKESTTLKCYYDRKTQYDLWQFDTAWIGKPVFVCGPVIGLSEEHKSGDTAFEGYLAPHFQSANRLVTQFTITNAGDEKTPVFHHGDTIRVDFSIFNPCGAPILFHHPDFGMCIKAQYLTTDDFGYCIHDDIEVFPPHSIYQGRLYTVVGDDIVAGRNRFNLGIGDRLSSFVTEESGVDIMIKD